MSELQNGLSAIAASCPQPLPEAQASQCEYQLNIGMFFDGTDNNKNRKEEQGRKRDCNTNITRLWEAYKEDPDQGYYRYYISGVGTPFSELERTKIEFTGSPFGAGGASRIHYGLLQIANSAHRFLCAGTFLYETKELDALCSSTRLPSETESGMPYLTPQQTILQKLGLSQGLDDMAEHEKQGFFQQIETQIIALAQSRKPKMSGIYIDVFGFSRGAAQARVFCSWLHSFFLKNGKLFGIPAYVRILGILDSVASVGPTNATGSHGHHAWASAANLQIHPEIKNCYHIVALHEFRTNFPAESVSHPDGSIPANCQEVFLPGAHSDIGGGYGAGEQGKIVRPGADASPSKDDGYRLSALPLNLMLEAAHKSCEGHDSPPWLNFSSAEGRSRDLSQRFSLEQLELVRTAVEKYFGLSCTKDRYGNLDEALRAHNARYLAWRYAVSKKNGFGQLPSVKNAQTLAHTPAATADKEEKSEAVKSLQYYQQGNEIFEKQIEWFSKNTDNNPKYHRQAPEIFEQIKNLQVDPLVGEFFDTWVHDSFAGFIGKFAFLGVLSNFTHGIAEQEGYLRWRGLYTGDDTNTLASNAEPNKHLVV